MKCPECVAAGKNSWVYPDGGATTDMCVDRYYDENGVLHVHDPNVTAMSYHCTFGHYWAQNVARPCPTSRCGYNQPTVDRT